MLNRRDAWPASRIRDLATQPGPGSPSHGLAVTVAALLVMPMLALAKRRTGQRSATALWPLAATRRVAS